MAGVCLSQHEHPWDALSKIGEYVLALAKTLPEELFQKAGDNVWIAKSARVHPSASITGPCIIDEDAEVRPGAFLRGNVLVGKHAVVGNSTELKNVILFDCVQVPHYNYVGDSILGYKAHMGAGAITSNVKGDKSPVVIKHRDGTCETGLKKCGAMLGDHAEIGCGCVLNPGTVIGKHTQVYPLCSVRGVVPPRHIYKSATDVVEKRSV
jgi:NDP-sugar pyrophosphorylase family protein